MDQHLIQRSKLLESLRYKWTRHHHVFWGITESNRIHVVLFGMQNSTFGPYLAAKHRILIPVMEARVDVGYPNINCCSHALFLSVWCAKHIVHLCWLAVSATPRASCARDRRMMPCTDRRNLSTNPGAKP
jgi:hypothetical protein